MTSVTPRRRTVVLLAATVLLILGAAVLWWAITPTTTTLGGNKARMATQTVQAGTVEVRMTPLTLDAIGAVFRVEFTTHSGSLDLDPAAVSQLRINGQITPEGTWSGSGPGGHHRDGTLRFTTPVPTGAHVELRISGLSQDAVGTWTAP